MSTQNLKISLDFAMQYAPNAVPPPPAFNNLKDYYSSEILLSDPLLAQPAPEIFTGHYTTDLRSGKYELIWSSLSAMEAWHKKEELANYIELKMKETVLNDKLHWDKKYVFVCTRQGTGGASSYVKKRTTRGRKVPTKRIGCPCRLVVKTYPNTAQVLGSYKNTHTHPIGPVNAKFTAISRDTRTIIEERLRGGVDPQRIVRIFLDISPFILSCSHSRYVARRYSRQHLKRDGAANKRSISHICRYPPYSGVLTLFITLIILIRFPQRMLEAENIRLDANDGESVLQWVERLRESGEVLAFKSSTCAVPKGSNLAADAFVLVIQTKYQQEMYRKWGNEFIGIDATHNTTHYEKMSLFTIMVRDQWGHGKQPIRRAFRKQ